MSEAAIRARIKVTLDTVSNKGLTHNRLRWAADESAFLDLFKTTIGSTVQIRGWMITWRGFAQTEPHLGRGANQIRVHTFELDGYLGLDDSASTEIAFAALAEAVANALDADGTLNARGLSLYREPTQIVMDERMFYGHLCHHALITLSVAEVI